jgi:DNA repair protein RecO
MAIIKTKGIVIKKVNYSNTSLILEFLTLDHGKISVLAKGIKVSTKSSKMDSLTDLLSLCSIVYYEKRNGLHILSECYIHNMFSKLRTDIKRWTTGYIVAELSSLTAMPESPDIESFYLVLYILNNLVDTKKDPSILLIYYLYKYLEANGIMPDIFTCTYSKKSLLAIDTFIWCPIRAEAFTPKYAPLLELTDELPTTCLHSLSRIITKNFNISMSTELLHLFVLLQEQVVIYLDKIPKTFLFLKELKD